jgi:hypothetical protein
MKSRKTRVPKKLQAWLQRRIRELIQQYDCHMDEVIVLFGYPFVRLACWDSLQQIDLLALSTSERRDILFESLIPQVRHSFHGLVESNYCLEAEPALARYSEKERKLILRVLHQRAISTNRGLFALEAVMKSCAEALRPIVKEMLEQEYGLSTDSTVPEQV